jgi:NAD(P)-dependent dehydrogenase (short-subunit alcohol dehydrogenase family)
MSALPLIDRTVLVTGGTDGIGYATAQRLVDDGATVILHAQNQQRGEDALARLIKAGAEPLRLQLVVADFTRLADVANLAWQITAEVPALDLLINNAAVAGPERRTYTDDGHEMTFQVNYLAPYMLTTALTDHIAKVQGRVINVSSALHRGGSVGWNDLTRARHYSPLAMYAQSKLALTMFTRSFAEANAGHLSALSVHPGVFDTGLLHVYHRVGRPASEAAEILGALSSPARTIVNGAYYDGLNPAPAAALVDNARARARLLSLSGQLTEHTDGAQGTGSPSHTAAANAG